MIMITKIGFQATRLFLNIGSITVTLGKCLKYALDIKEHYKRTMPQIVLLGIKSLNVTLITALFVGMAFTVQVVREVLRLGAGQLVGYIVGMAIWRELGPLLTGVVFCGRVGAAISAEIGTMKVTEQVEALESMSQNITKYLVLPRVVACSIVMPLLVGLADIVGFLGGFLVSLSTGKINPYSFFMSAQRMLSIMDIAGGLIKAGLFGIVIALISCHMGLKTKGGAKGVGINTTKAVVTSLITVFVLNYFLSLVIFK